MTKVMASVTSPPLQSGSSRRRVTGSGKESSSEDQALNMIAKEAEARLAAKRAARAEARSIRMKEIEKKQKEIGEEGGTSSDTDPPKENKYLTRASTLRGEEHIVPAYDVLDHVSNDKQILQLKETIKVGEEKYKKAMVNSAQLDNERQALQYQVEVLKDIIEELQQRVENTDDELLHKTREHNKLTREHDVTSDDLKKCLFLIEDRERVLDEHGVNIDGTIKEGYSSQSSTTQCSLCRASLNDDIDAVDSTHGKESLLAEIASLKSEIKDLKQTSNSEQSCDVALIHEDALCTELYANNKKYANGSQQSNEIPPLKLSTNTTTNMQSSVNMDSIRKVDKKYNYNIANVEDYTNSTLKINVGSYTDVDHTPNVSPTGSTSNINISNYLGGDYRDETLNDDGEHYTSFRVSRYFDTDTSTSSADNNNTNDNNGTSVDTLINIQSNIDVHANSDIQLLYAGNRGMYKDVQPSPQKAVEEIVTAENIPIEMSSPDDFIENLDIVNPGLDEKVLDEKRNKLPQVTSTDSEVNLYYQLNTSTGEDTSPDSSMNTAFCEENVDTNHKLPDAHNESITQIIRNDVEELYNQIADETTDNREIQSELFNPALPFASPSGGEQHKGWKVWLESSLVQKGKQPESKENNVLLSTEPTHSNEPAPEPKERKKKKKKKKK